MSHRMLMGYKRKLEEPVKWLLRPNKRLVCYAISNTEMVMTPDGEMMLASLKLQQDLSNPAIDIAVELGQGVNVLKRTGVVDPQSPELWYYNDSFWLKAKGSKGMDYYNNKRYLLYKVEIDNAQGLIDEIETDLTTH